LLTFKIFPGRSQITAKSTHHQLSCELHQRHLPLKTYLSYQMIAS
jgi:hypothetical protein